MVSGRKESLLFLSYRKAYFLYDGGCKGEKPPADKGVSGCLHPSKGTIGFPSEKKRRESLFSIFMTRRDIKRITEIT